MRSVIALVLILLAAPFASARAESTVPEKEPRPTIAQTLVEGAVPAQPPMVISEIRLPQSQAEAANALATQDMPRRGSFWWLVGVIVVAGVILAVLLD